MTQNGAVPRSAASAFLRFSAGLSIWWERFWPAIVPAFIVICVFLIVSWIGLWGFLTESFGDLARYAGLGVFAAALVFSLWFLRGVKWPDEASVTRRIEKKSLLENRPLTAQSDDMAMGDDDPFVKALWREHQTRMANRLENMTAGVPKPDGARFDGFALRAILPILVFAAFLFSFSGAGSRLGDALQPFVDKQDVLTRMDVWINPPTYTRKPPVYLSKSVGEEQPKAVSVPIQSEFYLRFVGNESLRLTFIDGDLKRQVEPFVDEAVGAKKGEIEYKLPLVKNGIIELSHRGDSITRWPLSVIADNPPEISFTEEPSAALSGSLQLNYSLSDDYGVVTAEADIKSLVPQEEGARPLVEKPELRLPLPRQRSKKGSAKVNRDLTKHPWAGEEVSIMLVARDDAGQEGRSKTVTMVLPGRNFSKPLAQALIQQRRMLALDANKASRVADLLDAVREPPEAYFKNASAVIGMAMAYRRIRSANSDDDLISALDILWDVALAVEFGDLSEAERRLREAQENLSEALENGASDEQIEQLMKELREAMNEFMRQLAEQMRNNPQQQNPLAQNDMSRQLSQRDLQRMMDEIENLAKSGSKDAAREMLSEMQRMMDNLRAGQHQQQRQAEGNQTNQALDKLSELMQEQQRLMDESFRMQQQQRQLQEQQQGQRRQGQQSQRQDQNQGQRQSRRNGQQQGQRQGQRQGQQRGQRGQNGQQNQSQQGQNGQGQNGQQGQQPGGQMSPQEFADALESLRQQQEALRQQLQELGQELEGLGLDPSEGFGRAQQEMGQAGENLGEGQPGSAMQDQGEALQALRDGAQQMMQQMAGDRQQGGQQQGQPGGSQAGAQQRQSDPLGRSREGNGRNNGEDVKVPGEIDAQTARRIMEAIRERLSNPARPTIEKDYLERLLKSR